MCLLSFLQNRVEVAGRAASNHWAMFLIPVDARVAGPAVWELLADSLSVSFPVILKATKILTTNHLLFALNRVDHAFYNQALTNRTSQWLEAPSNSSSYFTQEQVI